MLYNVMQIIGEKIIELLVTTLAFIITSYITLKYIAPMTKYNELRREICMNLRYHLKDFTNPVSWENISDNKERCEYYNKIQDTIFLCSCKLDAYADFPPHFKVIRRIFGIPSSEIIKETARKLTLLSHKLIIYSSREHLYVTVENEELIKQIRINLNITESQETSGQKETVIKKSFSHRPRGEVAAHNDEKAHEEKPEITPETTPPQK